MSTNETSQLIILVWVKSNHWHWFQLDNIRVNFFRFISRSQRHLTMVFHRNRLSLFPERFFIRCELWNCLADLTRFMLWLSSRFRYCIAFVGRLFNRTRNTNYFWIFRSIPSVRFRRKKAVKFRHFCDSLGNFSFFIRFPVWSGSREFAAIPRIAWESEVIDSFSSRSSFLWWSEIRKFTQF